MKLSTLRKSFVLNNGDGRLKVIEEFNICIVVMLLRKREGNKSDYMVEAFLAYWLTLYVLSIKVEDSLNQFIFPQAIKIADDAKLARHLHIWHPLRKARRARKKYPQVSWAL